MGKINYFDISNREEAIMWLCQTIIEYNNYYNPRPEDQMAMERFTFYYPNLLHTYNIKLEELEKTLQLIKVFE